MKRRENGNNEGEMQKKKKKKNLYWRNGDGLFYTDGEIFQRGLSASSEELLSFKTYESGVLNREWTFCTPNLRSALHLHRLLIDLNTVQGFDSLADFFCFLSN